jgi:DNA-binding transcriptional regulator YhcF (GntR family)
MREVTPVASETGNELRARDLERLIEGQIREGAYAPGSRLPTVRELGETYRVNKNTAARAYQALERRGLIDVARGRGAYVRDALPATNGSVRDWYERLDELVSDAEVQGLSRADLLERLLNAVERRYGPGEARVCFIECNTADLQTLSAELSSVTGVAFDQVLLRDAVRDPAGLGRRYDLIVTTFQHLGELRQAVPAAARHKVVGANAAPNHDSLLQLARTHVAAYALVCDTPSTVESLAHLVNSYNPGATVMPVLIEDNVQLRRALSLADAVVVTQSCRRRLPALDPSQTVVTIYFTIDQQSIEFLRRRLAELSELARSDTPALLSRS